MKKILFVLSVLSLMSYGCNRNQEDTGVGAGGNMQQEESRSQDIQEADVQNMDSPAMDSESQNMDETQNMDESHSMDKSQNMEDSQNMDESNEAVPSTSPASGQGTQQ